VDAISFDRHYYEATWGTLNRRLRTMEIATGTLTTSLETLYAQQCALGFIRDDLSSVERYRYQKPEDGSRFFSVQYNPARDSDLRAFTARATASMSLASG